mmetsp:Transcript_59902/g.194169  ORF Transcript_59902/g.194169 Transcript_59902/m.194169 type:complete len:83 (-) Transcript_59902:95-343(-)
MLCEAVWMKSRAPVVRFQRQTLLPTTQHTTSGLAKDIGVLKGTKLACTVAWPSSTAFRGGGIVNPRAHLWRALADGFRAPPG